LLPQFRSTTTAAPPSPFETHPNGGTSLPTSTPVIPRVAQRERFPSIPSWVPVAALVILSLLLRLTGLNWDAGQHLHPDERQITFVVNKLALVWPPDLSLLLSAKESPLDPHFFSYGSLPLYFLAFVGATVSRIGWLLNILVGHGPRPGLAFLRDAADYTEINLVGRILSSLFDTGTVVLLYVLGTRLYGRFAALVAAGSYAVTALAIQQSHFFVVDPVLTFLVTLTIVVAYRAMEAPSPRLSALLGVLLGATVATKVSAAPLALLVTVAHLASYHSRERTLRWLHPRDWMDGFPRLVGVAVVALLTFALCEPYALINSVEFSRDITAQNAMVRGVADFPYTRQYTHTPAYTYWFKELVLWQLGIPLGVLACLGTLFVCFRSVLRYRSPEIVFLSWLVPYVVVTGSFYAKFPRYMLPAVPSMLLCAAALLVALRHIRWTRHLSVAIGALVILLSGFWALAYTSVYRTENTRVAASHWIYSHVPAGSMLIGEHWDDALPLNLPHRPPGQNVSAYKQTSLPIYDDDNAAKLNVMATSLQQGSYVVISSDIVRGSVLRVPERYPMMRNYYHALFAGDLGYQLVASFVSYPTLFGISIPDNTADLNWEYYDHPRVFIFQNQEHLSAAQLMALIGPPLEKPWQPGRDAMAQQQLQVSRSDLAANLAGPVYDDMFPATGLGMQFPIPVWLIVLELLGLLALPLTALIMSSLADVGACIAKTLGWIVLAYATWMLASTHLMTFSRTTIWVVFAAMVVLSVALVVLRADVRERLRRSWRFLVASELMFLLAFAAFLAIRVTNPDLWHPNRGGEKPMEMTYINGILRSVYFPPYDPWLSGTYNNYYYFGLSMVATLFKWTQIAPSYGFNLAVPTLFALSLEGAFGIAVTLARHVRTERLAERLGHAESGEDVGAAVGDGFASVTSGIASAAWHVSNAGGIGRWLRDERGPLLAGLGSALMLGVMGNLAALVQVVQNLRRVSAPAVDGGPSLPLLTGAAEALRGLLTSIASGGTQFPQFDYWGPTRVIPFTINEFPFFSFLYADLHPHMIDIAVSLVSVALACNLALGGVGDLVPVRVQGRRLRGHPTVTWVATFVVAIVATGVIGPTNFFDLATYLGLVTLSVVICQWRRSGRTFLRAALDGLWWGIALFIGGRLFFRPFYQHFLAQSGGVGLPMHHSELGPFLQVYGLLFFVAFSFAVAEFGRWHRQNLFLVVPGILLGLITMSVPVCLLTTFLLLLLGTILKRQPGAAWLTLSLLTATAGALVLGTELLYVRDPLEGGDYQRMNSVFKFGVQAWVLFSVALGPSLLVLFRGYREAAREENAAVNEAVAVADGLLAPGRLAPIAGGEDDERSDADASSRQHPAWVVGPHASMDVPDRHRRPFSLREGGRQREAFDETDEWDERPGGRQFDEEFDATEDDEFDAEAPAFWQGWNWRALSRRVWATLLVFLFLASWIYPIAATSVRVRDRFDNSIVPTLDGLAFLRRVYPGDAAAIAWLNAHVDGNKVEAEAFKDIYAYYSRVSWYTGLPTILGWDNHERQFHAAALVDARRPVLDRIYNDTDPGAVLQLLSEYHVSFIYLGDVERKTYKPTGLAKFAGMEGHGLEKVYDELGVVIYHVDGQP